MSHTNVVNSLRALDRWLARSQLLTADSRQVLQDAIRHVQESHQAFETWGSRTHHAGAGQKDWGFGISPDRPLRFRRADHIGGLLPEADVHGMMRWWSENDQPDDASIVLRVWSGSEAYFYREGWDAERFCDMITAPENTLGRSQRRVLLRLHFDLRKHEARNPEPLYHLHVGGQARHDELCWFPDGIDSLRIPFVPVDLVLACEMVIADLFAHRYAALIRDPAWKYLVQQSQARVLKPYLEDCLHAIDSMSWLGHLHCAEHRNYGG